MSCDSGTNPPALQQDPSSRKTRISRFCSRKLIYHPTPGKR